MQKFLFMLLSLVLLGPLGIDLYLPTIPAIAVGLGSSEALIQSTISLFILVLGLGQVIAGPLVDNYGRKPVALAGIILYMIGAAMAALATSPTVFIASRLLQGVAVCCTAVVAFSGVRDRLNGDDAARAFGFLNGTLNIIPALAPLLGGLLAEASAGARLSGSWSAMRCWCWCSSRCACRKPAPLIPCRSKDCRCANTRASSANAASSPLRW